MANDINSTNSPLEIERLGFFKQCITALSANYWAYNTSIDLDEIANRAAVLTHKLWIKILEDRHGKDSA